MSKLLSKVQKKSKKEKKEKSKRNVGWVVRRQFGPVLSSLAALLHFCIVTFYLPCTHSNLNFAFFANLLSASVQINTLLSHLFCARSLFEVTSFSHFDTFAFSITSYVTWHPCCEVYWPSLIIMPPSVNRGFPFLSTYRRICMNLKWARYNFAPFPSIVPIGQTWK